MKKYNWEQEQIAGMKEYIARFGHGSAKLARQAQVRGCGLWVAAVMRPCMHARVFVCVRVCIRGRMATAGGQRTMLFAVLPQWHPSTHLAAPCPAADPSTQPHIPPLKLSSPACFPSPACACPALQSKEKVLAKMVLEGLTKRVESDRVVKFQFTNVGKLPPPVLQFSDVTFGYSKDKVLYRNVDLGADLDSRVAIVSLGGGPGDGWGAGACGWGAAGWMLWSMTRVLFL
jgi:hypothetical protein